MFPTDALIAWFCLIPFVFSASPPTKAYEVFPTATGNAMLVAKVDARASFSGNTIDQAIARGQASCD